MLTNSELMILQIISTNKDISGYEINKYVTYAEYNVWAEIGKTSIYSSLKKLEKKQFITAEIDLKKKGKGPLPYKYNISEEGVTMLHEEMIGILSTAGIRNRSFDLTLSALQLLQTSDVIKALESRMVFLQSEISRINEEYNERKSCIDLGPDLLYQHIFCLIETEITFTEKIILNLKTRS